MSVEYIGRNGPDGMTLGSSATEKVSLYGVTPVVQAATIAAVATTAATSTSPFGFTEAQANAIISGLNSCVAALKNLGVIASA